MTDAEGANGSVGTSDSAAGSGPTRVAIACQGGGSHTAFTAGVLQGLLREWDHERHELVGISGTSGGAFNALAAWYGLVTAGEERAIDLLDDLWADLAATGVLDRWTNDFGVWAASVESNGVAVPRVSPYFLPGATRGQDRIREILEAHVDFDAIPDLCQGEFPRLVVGTVNVNEGEFETFTDEAVTTDAVLASAALPELFPAVEIHGHLHWDGMFSQNPPIDDLMRVAADRKPTELWIVQINPQRRDGVPRSIDEIMDRRNELSGNLSLNQELRFIETVNRWIDAGHLPRDRYSRTTVRTIEMGRRYGHTTKLDRRPAFVRSLMALGEERAAEFLETLGPGTTPG